MGPTLAEPGRPATNPRIDGASIQGGQQFGQGLAALFDYHVQALSLGNHVHHQRMTAQLARVRLRTWWAGGGMTVDIGFSLNGAGANDHSVARGAWAIGHYRRDCPGVAARGLPNT